MRFNGKVFEAVAARLERRATQDLFHSALVVTVPEGSFVIEQAPAKGHGAERGVVAAGPVGAHWAGRFPLFRYEIRRWHGGVIPDLAEAVESPMRLTDDLRLARRVLELVPTVPTLVWGRDELRAGEMWNSNSFIAWILCRAGVDLDEVHPPSGGRAPAGRPASSSRDGTTQSDRMPTENPAGAGLSMERMMGLEPTTFCMASRRSSQLSYIRTRRSS